MGCGYAPPPSEKMRVHVERSVWDGTSLGRVRMPDERDERGRLLLPVCPGYVCTLPEVREVSWAHSYWEKGELTQWCEGQSTAQLRSAIDVSTNEAAAVLLWSAENPVKK